jgi:hypothetical protein
MAALFAHITGRNHTESKEPTPAKQGKRMPNPSPIKKTAIWVGVVATLVVVVNAYTSPPTKPGPLEGVKVHPMKLYSKERDHVVGVLCENGTNNDCAFFLDAVRSVPNLRVAGDDADADPQPEPEFWFVFHKIDAFSYKTMISKEKKYREYSLAAFLYTGAPSDGSEGPLHKDSAKSDVRSLLSQVD